MYFFIFVRLKSIRKGGKVNKASTELLVKPWKKVEQLKSEKKVLKDHIDPVSLRYIEKSVL